MTDDYNEKPDCREKGAWIASGDSGGRFGRSPSLYWHRFKCVNFPGKCKGCRHYFDDCGLSGTFMVFDVVAAKEERQEKKTKEE